MEYRNPQDIDNGVETRGKELWSLVPLEGGFLSRIELPEIPFQFSEHERICKNLLSLSKAGRLREEISKLPIIFIRTSSTSNTLSYPHFHFSIDITQPYIQQTVLTLLAVLASGYVHTPPTLTNITLPPTIALPIINLSQATGRPPIWDYAGCVLSNWKLIDHTRSLSLENITILRTITDLECETWFYKVHVVIEAYGGQALEALQACREITTFATHNLIHLKLHVGELLHKTQIVREKLKYVAAAVQLMKLTFARLTEKCKDKDFFHILRPWLNGWPDAGVTYEISDTQKEVLKFGGPSGAQSTLLPILDAFLGVDYFKAGAGQSGSDEFSNSLKRFRTHMPQPHRELLLQVESNRDANVRTLFSVIKDVVLFYFPSKAESIELSDIPNLTFEANEDKTRELKLRELPMFLKEKERMEVGKLLTELVDLKQVYNLCIETILQFRRLHFGFAVMYITRQAKNDNQESKAEEKEILGTGGSRFEHHFLSHIHETRKALFKLPSDNNLNFNNNTELQSDIESMLELDSSNASSTSYVYGIFEALKDHIYKISHLLDKPQPPQNLDD